MRYRKRFLRFVLAGAALFVAFACANEGQGERCDPLSGNADCSAGLICKANLPNLPSGSAICCPVEGSGTAQIPACLGTNGFPTGPDGGQKVDAGARTPKTDAGAKVADAGKRDAP